MPFVKKKINEINLRTYLYRYKRNNDLRFLGQKIITSKIAEKGKTLKNQFLSRHELFKDIQKMSLRALFLKWLAISKICNAICQKKVNEINLRTYLFGGVFGKCIISCLSWIRWKGLKKRQLNSKGRPEPLLLFVAMTGINNFMLNKQ